MANEVRYHFQKLDKDQALDVQRAIDLRLMQPDIVQKKSDRAIKFVIEELDQMKTDIDRRIAEIVREEAFRKEGNNL